MVADPIISMPEDYLAFVNTWIDEDEKEQIEHSIIKSKPFGANQWTEDIVEKYNLKATIRKRGRQIKGT